MIDGLEVVPRRVVDYRGARFEEMDLDAVLARHPQVALVDELAHTNVPGSRNAKRWQDIDELLDAGIDVISTVNIQHLESLNDVVEAITGVEQRETVPDAVVRAADQIELVDMSPEALRRRLAHGNVYSPRRSTPPSATTSGPATSPRCASSRCCGSPTGSRRGWSATAPTRHPRHVGGARAHRRRAHRRARGRDAAPPRIRSSPDAARAVRSWPCTSCVATAPWVPARTTSRGSGS